MGETHVTQDVRGECALQRGEREQQVLGSHLG
jgi:hypothetical protein